MEDIGVVDKFEQIEDTQELVALMKKQMSVVGGDPDDDKILASLKNALKEESRGRIFVYRNEDSNLAGFAFGNICSGLESGGDYLWINELYTHELYRGRGVGRKIIQYIEEWCRENNISYIACITGTTNDTAQSFYKKLDYELSEGVWVDKSIVK